MSPGLPQILLIALIILVLFGGARLGGIGKGLGEGIRNFKKGLAGDDEDEPEPEKEPPQLPAKPDKLSEGGKNESGAADTPSSEAKDEVRK